MSAQNPPKNAQAYSIYVALNDFSTPGAFKANPTLAAGDWKISKDGGGFNNLTTLPSVAPAAGVGVLITLSGTEMTADNVLIVGIDQTSPKEWSDFALCIQTTA